MYNISNNLVKSIKGEIMFCDQCGEENRNDRKFCTNCGAKLKDYTKPRENLLMPEDVKIADGAIKRYKRTNLVLKIILALLVIIAIVFLILTFFFDEPLKLYFSIVSLSCLVVYCLFAIIRKLYVKKNRPNTNNQ